MLVALALLIVVNLAKANEGSADSIEENLADYSRLSLGSILSNQTKVTKVTISRTFHSAINTELIYVFYTLEFVMIPNSIYQSSRLSHLEDELKELRQLVTQSKCSKNICRNLKKFQKAESAEILRLTTRLTAFENSINAKLAYGQVAFTGTS